MRYAIIIAPYEEIDDLEYQTKDIPMGSSIYTGMNETDVDYIKKFVRAIREDKKPE